MKKLINLLFGPRSDKTIYNYKIEDFKEKLTYKIASTCIPLGYENRNLKDKEYFSNNLSVA